MTDKLSYSLREAAAAVGVSHETIRKLVREQQIDTFMVPGVRRRLIARVDLERFIEVSRSPCGGDGRVSPPSESKPGERPGATPSLGVVAPLGRVAGRSDDAA